MQEALEIFSALGIFAMVALALFLLGAAQRRVCATAVRSYMDGENPMGWFNIGFLNTVISCDGNSSSSTVFGYAHSKMLSQNGVLYSLLGIAVAPITFSILVAGILKLTEFYYFVLPVLGIGYLTLLASDKTKNAARMVMALGLLAYALFLSDTSISILFARYIHTYDILALTSFGVWAIVLGCGMGIGLSVLFRNSLLTCALSLMLFNDGLIGGELIIGMIIGAIAGGVFMVAPIAAKGGAIVLRAFLQHAVSIVLALVMFCVAYPILAKVILQDSVTSMLSLFLIFLLALLPLATYLSKFIAKPIALIIPNVPKEGNHLVMLSNTHRPDPTLSLLQVQKEIVNHTRRTYKMLSFLRDMISENGDNKEKVVALFDRVSKYKIITDKVENEIVSYICAVALGDISKHNTTQMKTAISAIGQVNQMADCILNAAELVEKGFNKERTWDQEQLKVLALAVHKVQMLQYAVIAIMDENKQENIEQLYQELIKVINLSNDKYYLYNQVLIIETLAEIKKIGKILCNLVKK